MVACIAVRFQAKYKGHPLYELPRSIYIVDTLFIFISD